MTASASALPRTTPHGLLRDDSRVVDPAPMARKPGVGSGKSRLVGIDVARGLALLGMIAVHALIPYDENFNPNWVSFVATGHASALFAVLAGVGLSLTTGRARVPRAQAVPTAAALAARAAVVGGIGLALGYSDADIAGVILPYYAVLFLLAIPLVLMRSRSLVMVGLAAAVVVPVLSQLVRPWLPEPTLENPTFGYLLTDPLGLLSELLVTGSYPALPWVSYICAGLVVGRLRLSSMKTAWGLLAVGAAMAVAAVSASSWLLGPVGGRAALLVAGTGELDDDLDPVPVDELLAFGFDGTTPTTSWWWLAVRSPHAAAPLDLLSTIGTSVAVLGAMLLLGHVTQPILRRVIDVITAPLAAAGAMTLTLYAAHIMFMNSPLDGFRPVPGFVVQVVAVLLIGLGWRQAVGRGPLETAVTAAAFRARTFAVAPAFGFVDRRRLRSGTVVRPARAVPRGKHRATPAASGVRNGLRPPGASRAAGVDAGTYGPGVGSGKSRLVGIDVARGLALLGMIAVHALIPYDENFNPNWVSFVATGHASALFAVLAGVGLSLTTGRARVPRAQAVPTAAALAARAAVVGGIGLALGYSDADIAGVILPYYAVLFLLAIPLVLMRSRSLVMVGLAAAVVVPVLSQLVRPWLPEPTLENPTFGYLLTDPLGLLSELLVTGSYPALPWVSYICAGLVVGRLRLSSMKTAWGLLAVGAAMAVAAVSASSWLLGPMGGRAALLVAGTGELDDDLDPVPVDELLAFGFDGTTPTTSWWWLAVRSPHAAAPLDLLSTIGTSVAVLGAMLLLGHVTQPILRRVIDVITAPLAAAGAMTLTLYAAHIMFMNSPLDGFRPVPGFVVQVVAVLLVGLLWVRLVGRGPLERLVSAAAARARRAAQPPPELSPVPAPAPADVTPARPRLEPQRSSRRHRAGMRLPDGTAATPTRRPVTPTSATRRISRRRP